MKKEVIWFVVFIVLMSFSVVSISAFNFEDPIYGLEFTPEVITFDNNTAFVNATSNWVTTSLGVLTDANISQLENNGNVLSIIQSFLTNLISVRGLQEFLALDGSNANQNIDIGVFNFSTEGVFTDSLDTKSIDMDNRQLLAQDGVDIILDYFILGVADFGDSRISTTNNISSNWFNGKFNWTTGDDWNIFDGSILTFNESKLSTTFFNATTVEVITGTPEGAIGDLQSYNNIPYNVTEDASDLELRVNFSVGVGGDFNELIIRYKSAEEDLTHTMIVQIYEVSSSTWEGYGTLPGTSHYHLVEFGVFDSDEHVDVNGIVQVRMFQDEGVPPKTHLHNFDWVTISKGFGTPTGEEVDPDSIHKDGDVPWIGNEQGNGFNTTGWDWFIGNTLNVSRAFIGDLIIEADNITVNNIISKDGNISFWNGTDKKMVINQDGNVGIGTSSPDSIFHIKANIAGSVGSHSAGQLIIQNPADDVTSNVVITAYESDGDGNPDQQLWYLGSSSSSNSNIILLNRRNALLQFGTSSTARMTILGNGDVGIGTTSPTHKLNVVGSVNITLSLIANEVNATRFNGSYFGDGSQLTGISTFNSTYATAYYLKSIVNSIVLGNKTSIFGALNLNITEVKQFANNMLSGNLTSINSNINNNLTEAKSFANVIMSSNLSFIFGALNNNVTAINLNINNNLTEAKTYSNLIVQSNLTSVDLSDVFWKNGSRTATGNFDWGGFNISNANVFSSDIVKVGDFIISGDVIKVPAGFDITIQSGDSLALFSDNGADVLIGLGLGNSIAVTGKNIGDVDSINDLNKIVFAIGTPEIDFRGATIGLTNGEDLNITIVDEFRIISGGGTSIDASTSPINFSTTHNVSVDNNFSVGGLIFGDGSRLRNLPSADLSDVFWKNGSRFGDGNWNLGGNNISNIENITANNYNGVDGVFSNLLLVDTFITAASSPNLVITGNSITSNGAVFVLDSQSSIDIQAPITMGNNDITGTDIDMDLGSGTFDTVSTGTFGQVIVDNFNINAATILSSSTMTLQASNQINLKPNGDVGDFFVFSTSGNNPSLTVSGANLNFGSEELTTTGKIGIGFAPGTSPDESFDIRKSAADAIMTIDTYSSSSATHNAILKMRRSRGTLGNLATTNIGDRIGQEIFYGVNAAANAFRFAALVIITQEDDAGDDLGSKMSYLTYKSNGGANAGWTLHSDNSLRITGNVTIGSDTVPLYPLQVEGSATSSKISIWAEHNVSATGYISRTSVFDKEKGSALDWIYDSDYYIDDGEINHSKFSGYVKAIPQPDTSRPVIIRELIVNDTDRNNKRILEYVNRTTYPFIIMQEGVLLDEEINTNRQGIYELKLIVCQLDSCNIKFEWCGCPEL